MSYTPRVMSAEWVYRNLVLPLSRAGLQSDTVEAMLSVRGAVNRWVASLPEHIKAAEAELEAQRTADKLTRQQQEQKKAAALLIKDRGVSIEDIDLGVRAYNTLKRMGISTVREVLRHDRSRDETQAATQALSDGPADRSLYRRLVAGGIEEHEIPDWIPRR